jgi:hypothetical protein
MLQQILQYLSAINIKLNSWETNAKKTEELPALPEIDAEGLLRVSVGGESKKMPLSMILSAIPDGGSGESAQRNQNNITFTNVNGDFFGTAAAPRTGALTIDTTGAVLGGNACVFYNNATLNVTPTPDLIVGNFAPDELNAIFILRSGGGFLIANIINSGSTPGTPSATAPTITVTDPIFNPNAPAATAPTITVTNP